MEDKSFREEKENKNGKYKDAAEGDEKGNVKI